MEFKDLPIRLSNKEYGQDGWSRTVQRDATISDLLEIWDIDGDDRDDSMSQVLRYLRDYVKIVKEQRDAIRSALKIQDLWLPPQTVPVDYEDESAALMSMWRTFKELDSVD